MHRGRRRFGESGVQRFHALWQLNQVALRYCDLFGEGAGPVHTDQVTLCTEVGPATQAMVATAACNEGVEHYLATRALSFCHGTGSFVTEDQRWYPAGIMTEVGMHVRSTYAHGLDPDQDLSAPYHGVRFIPVLDLFCVGVDQRLHYFAVKPPSTYITCPVT